MGTTVRPCLRSVLDEEDVVSGQPVGCVDAAVAPHAVRHFVECGVEDGPRRGQHPPRQVRGGVLRVPLCGPPVRG
jgi:hypothetical protein